VFIQMSSGELGVTAARPTIARAFAPAHVTGVFRPFLGPRDPRARGSLGAGIVLELGVHATATWVARGPRRVRVASDLPVSLPISEEAARRLFPARNGTLSVRLTHQLPPGQGFGLSAAGATATALAVSALFDRPRASALATAHLADLFGGGGLGGVAAIATGGGLEVRTRAGIPPWGCVRHLPVDGNLLIGIVGGPLPSPRILRDRGALGRIERASEELSGLVDAPSVHRFFEASERFTDRVGLTTPRLRTVLRALRQRGAYAAQAMFGRTFFAQPRTDRSRSEVLAWLQRTGLATLELRASRGGARRLGARASAEQPF
jgi:pantoate kinase